MLQLNIAYDALLEFLSEISTDTQAETFSVSIGDSIKETEFAGLFDLLDSLIEEITTAKDTQELYANYDALANLLDDFEENFSTYIVKFKDEIRLYIAVSKAISNQIVDLTSPTPIITTEFELIPVNDLLDYDIDFYHYTNLTDYSQSLFVLNVRVIKDLDAYLSHHVSIDVKLLFILLSKINRATALTMTKYALIKAGNSVYPKRITAAILLHYVSDGHPFHKALHFLDKPINNWRSEIKVENKYQQFSETIYIISEYNSTKDILDKYLRLYHVIEDFMYKSSLVKLELEKSGAIFSIRDFKRMNKEISNFEIEALEKFILKFLALEHATGVTFKTRFFSQWQSLLSFYPGGELEIENVLKKFIITIKFVDIKEGGLKAFLSQLIYNVRNSIVHNKSTEFHLTYNNMDNDTFKLMSIYLLKVMEEIVFYLVSKHNNDLVWFRNTSMMLWEDN